MNNRVLFLLAILMIPTSIVAAGLDGVWRSTKGDIVVIYGSQWIMQEHGLWTDRGTYTTQGNVLTARSLISGMIQVYRVSSSENSLVSANAYGQPHVYRRLGTEGYAAESPSTGFDGTDQCGGMSFEDCLIYKHGETMDRYNLKLPQVDIWK